MQILRFRDISCWNFHPYFFSQKSRFNTAQLWEKLTRIITVLNTHISCLICHQPRQKRSKLFFIRFCRTILRFIFQAKMVQIHLRTFGWNHLCSSERPIMEYEHLTLFGRNSIFSMTCVNMVHQHLTHFGRTVRLSVLRVSMG